MNLNNLHKLLDCYEENLNLIYNSEHDELFKWRAIKHFQETWKKEENRDLSFSQRFNLAKKESSVLIDNSRISPSNGIVKLAEVAEKEVEHLFFDVLLADDGGNIETRQNNMDAFLEKTDNLLTKHYPQFWKYKQDRHAASCYLSFFKPEENYIYRYTEVERFAQYIEFGLDIGSGASFRLDAYYKMCDEVIAALEEHPTLKEKQNKFIEPDEHYDDKAWHLFVFNLIWCASTYNFYRGMTHKPKKESIKDFTIAKMREKEIAELEEKRVELVSSIELLESKADSFKEISLLGIQVTDKSTDTMGTIISQDVNRIKVKYPTCEKSYFINKKFSARPYFEDDSEIVALFTEYDEIKEQIKRLKSELARLKS